MRLVHWLRDSALKKRWLFILYDGVSGILQPITRVSTKIRPLQRLEQVSLEPKEGESMYFKGPLKHSKAAPYPRKQTDRSRADSSFVRSLFTSESWISC